MSEDLSTIPDFPDYDVTSRGRVLNRNSGRQLTLTPTTGGALTVGLYDPQGRRHCLSVKVLVAKAFVEGENQWNNTPILIDGDETNLDVYNIRWRGRGFAHEYKRQLNNPIQRYFLGPVRDVENGYTYETVMDAAVTYGCLCKDILRSIYEWGFEPITGHRFAWLEYG